ncbi:helix-turn-helix domain-containing protein [Fimbriiglobus ruber]|uniref:HTH cro/C1-type domain-containing protein n=1 Tax=Fimbriiglobus ruber TaxID=1908690 RepID=A0A225D8U6_9BACT|nr:helix-turn-helix transcriptional regulator [Fimbriiglobus ruber]OWK37393.1 hypothetical protein FRUB_06513 [Fimbriiglobus ruber]
MIKNDRQYQATKLQADKFAVALRQAEEREYSDSLLADLERDALRSQLDDLRAELAEYDRLRSGQVKEIQVDTVDRIPQALISARIAAGLSQKELAERLGLKEQQIQRYEVTDYASAGLSRILEVMRALGGGVRLTMTVPTAVPSGGDFLKRLAKAGVSKELVTRRLLDPETATKLESADRGESETAVLRAASTVSRVYGWPTDLLFGNAPLAISPEVAGLARFKMPSRASESHLGGYVIYAHHLAGLALKAAPTLAPTIVPTEAGAFAKALLSRHGSMTFETALRYAWDLGVVVLPLRDSGAFHGACWRVAGRNVVVLKQRTASLARWLIDLLHELFHAGQEPDKAEREVIEAAETSTDRRESDEEQAAVQFSGDVALGGRAEELADLCVREAGGRVERLKVAVPAVAARERVAVDVLANYMAFRLSLQGVNWWGAATNLQPAGQNPWAVARDWLLQRLTLDALDPAERDLLLLALTTEEES